MNYIVDEPDPRPEGWREGWIIEYHRTQGLDDDEFWVRDGWDGEIMGIGDTKDGAIEDALEPIKQEEK